MIASASHRDSSYIAQNSENGRCVVVSSMVHFPHCSSLCPICLICASDYCSHLSCKLKALKRLDGPLQFILNELPIHCNNVFSAQALMFKHLIFCLLPFTK